MLPHLPCASIEKKLKRWLFVKMTSISQYSRGRGKRVMSPRPMKRKLDVTRQIDFRNIAVRSTYYTTPL